MVVVIWTRNYCQESLGLQTKILNINVNDKNEIKTKNVMSIKDCYFTTQL